MVGSILRASWQAISRRNILTHLDCGLARKRRLFSSSMKKLTFISAILMLISSATHSVLAQQDAQVSNVSADIRAMIERSQAGNGFDSMARMQVDVQFGEFLSSLGNNPTQRQEVEDALVQVIRDRAELSSEVATRGGSAAQLETLSSYAYLRSQLAPLLNNAQLRLLDEQQGAVAERNLRNNYGQELARIAPDVTEANREMVLDILVPHMLFRGENADQRNQLAPDEVVNQQLMSLRDAREELQSRLTGIQLDQVNSFFNQIRSNLFLNQSMYDAQ